MTAPSNRPWLKIVAGLIVVGVAVAAAMNWNKTREIVQSVTKKKAEVSKPADPLVQLVPNQKDTIRLTKKDAINLLGLRLAEVRSAPAPEPLRLPGSLFLDPNRLIHVHSRFGGEAVSIGQAVDENGKKRSFQYGDRVKKGELLAVVWSKEIGEKKSELMDALSRLDASRNILARLESLQPGIVTERSILEARRAVDGDVIAVSRAERTLRSWRMTDAEIAAVHKELELIKSQQKTGNARVDREWAEIEVRAAIDGVIMEKNFNVGDMVEPTDDLFKIADLGRLQVLANIYEEDLWSVRALKPEDRRWTIDLKSDPNDNQIPGTFDLIGSVIDPAQRTGIVMGWLDNSEGNLAVGQFITATIQLPEDADTVAIPETALIEEGDSSTVFVETDRNRMEFARRKVAVVRRSSGTVYIDSAPTDGVDQALHAGERVVTAGALGLGGELAILRTNQTSADNAQQTEAESDQLGLAR